MLFRAALQSSDAVLSEDLFLRDKLHIRLMSSLRQFLTNQLPELPQRRVLSR